MKNELNVSEKFYSIQCEGVTTGFPAYFIRLKGCNLSCGISSEGISNILKTGKGNIDSGSFVGDLHQQDKATWTCDSAPIWLFGNRITYEQIVQDWIDEGIFEWVKWGRVHIIWTGGEPTMPIHQEAIVGFLNWFKLTYPESSLYSEIETNGTFYINDELFNHLNQINCSAKLENSGMAESKRIKPDALRRIVEHKNYWFKFVISNESDLEEIITQYRLPFHIDQQRLIIMPGLDAQENFHERTKFILETAKKYGFIGLTRLHISAWDKTCGV